MNGKNLMLAMAGMLAMTSDPFIGRTNFPEREVKFSDKSKRLFGEPHRELREFLIKGHKIMAYSKKDAITRLKHQKKI